MVWKIIACYDTPFHQTILIFLFNKLLHLKLSGMGYNSLDKRCNGVVGLGKEGS